MADSVADLDDSIKLNQCLFGYDDGHRLLASSLRLPDDAASSLLLHSDLVPGLNARNLDGYWTGMPVPSAKAYALMRTWLAPEMPRPGCVWTHAVLIPFSDIARFGDLATIQSLFRRPKLSVGYDDYSRPLYISQSEHLQAPSGIALPSHEGSLRVLRAIYSASATGLLLNNGESLDTLDTEIFAAWSQQWPRLRRSFSFQTAPLVAEPSVKSPFDLLVVRGPFISIPAEYPVEPTSLLEWEQVAVDDLLGSAPSPLRRFLWRYGSDIRLGRKRFGFLAALFLSTRVQCLDGHKLRQTLDSVVKALPSLADGKLLKEDLLSCGRSVYSLLPATDPIATLEYVVGHADIALPEPPDVAFEAIQDLWATRASDILAIAEQAVGRSSPVGDRLVHRLSAVVASEDFLALSSEQPLVRRRLLTSNPALLDSPDLAALPPHELSSLLEVVPQDEDLATRLLGRLVTSDSQVAAAFFTERFPISTRDRVFDALARELAGSGPAVPRVWPEEVRRRTSLLPTDLLERASTTTALGALVRWLGLNVAEGMQASTVQWAETLLRAEDDIDGVPRQRLLAFLLALALSHPQPGCEPLVERAFEPVHTDIGFSRLPYDAFNTIAPLLPSVHWWEHWDTCFRLRLAVVRAYVGAGLDPMSFRRLTTDATLFDKLVNIASDTKKGRHFLEQLRT